MSLGREQSHTSFTREHTGRVIRQTPADSVVPLESGHGPSLGPPEISFHPSDNRLVQSPRIPAVQGFQRLLFSQRRMPPVYRGLSGAVIVERGRFPQEGPVTQLRSMSDASAGNPQSAGQPTEGATGKIEPDTPEPQAPVGKFTVLRLNKREDGLEEHEGSDEIREQIMQKRARQRERALSIFPDSNGGETAERIDAFFAREGLVPKPLIVVTPEMLPEFVDAMKEVGFSPSNFSQMRKGRFTRSGIEGKYFPNLGLTFALRPARFKNPAQELYFNFVVGHEKAHSTSTFQDEVHVLNEEGPLQVASRLGLNIWIRDETPKGIALEEGWATNMGARIISTEFNNPFGAWKTPKFQRFGSTGLPPIYIYPGPKGGLLTERSSPIAYGLDLLTSQRPDLHAALNDARSSYRGLADVRGILDVVSPGLYTNLEGLEDGFDNAAKGLRAIQKALAPGKK